MACLITERRLRVGLGLFALGAGIGAIIALAGQLSRGELCIDTGECVRAGEGTQILGAPAPALWLALAIVIGLSAVLTGDRARLTGAGASLLGLGASAWVTWVDASASGGYCISCLFVVLFMSLSLKLALARAILGANSAAATDAGAGDQDGDPDAAGEQITTGP